ncbi:putative class II peroxidase [Hypoxylon sp. FL1284]|nr:putative class II peroxidase [Hypoxylon sp. FL1284]
MKISTLLVGLGANHALAYPGMGKTMAEIQARQDLTVGRRSSNELLGDLRTKTDLSTTGSSIKGILQGSSAVAGSTTYTPSGELTSDACKKSVPCVWHYIIQDLSNAFVTSNGCTDLARASIRMGFHDAATWDKDSTYGGADGSLLLSDEMSRSENKGLEDIAAQTKTWYNQYKGYGISMADLIQTAALVGTVACPGGPRIRHFVGRKDNSKAGPTNKLPLPEQNAEYLVNLFAAKTFDASDLVSLLGAHSVAKQKFVDPARSGASQDTTPNIWDTKYYSETIKGDNKTIFIFHSDKSISEYKSTSAQFSTFAGSSGTSLWSPSYAQAYFRMSMLGVNNLNDLTEITQVLPLPRPT